MSGNIVLSEDELLALTGYQNGTKQLNVLHSRGFVRAFIAKDGKVKLERTHYEAVTKGELHTATKRANLSFLKAA